MSRRSTWRLYRQGRDEVNSEPLKGGIAEGKASRGDNPGHDERNTMIGAEVRGPKRAANLLKLHSQAVNFVPSARDSGRKFKKYSKQDQHWRAGSRSQGGGAHGSAGRRCMRG